MTRPFIQFVINRSMRIRTTRGTGTAFMYATAAGTAFLTAGHNLRGAQTGENVLFQGAEGWRQFPITALNPHADYDACAFCIGNFTISENLPPSPDLGSMLGDELMFIGFPHDLVNTYPNAQFAMPLVRQATFSGIIKVGSADIAILDGFNNPGYSGAPVYAAGGERDCSLFGLVSGYRFERPEHGRIFRQLPGGGEEPVQDLYAKTNSGMIQVVPRGTLDQLMNDLGTYLTLRPDSPVAG